jgi:ribosomal protein L35
MKKRIKRSSTGKVLFRRPSGRHFLSKKSAARKRGYGRDYELTGEIAKNVKKMLGE